MNTKTTSTHAFTVLVRLCPSLLLLSALALAAGMSLASAADNRTKSEEPSTSKQAVPSRRITAQDINVMTDEASLEYFIAHAGRLQSGDQKQLLVLAKQRLEQLKAQRQKATPIKARVESDGLKLKTPTPTPAPKHNPSDRH